ncbi:MAG: PAS domain S-box protein [Deltaproteobacteria bacterium]|nr:PAS domain S-box protein [Deltaproteobacteria bacterium]
MTTPKPMRIAIILNGEEFICPPVTLPFALEGHPPVELVWFGAAPEVGATTQAAPLTEMRAEDFDLILDAEFLAAGLPDFSPKKLQRFITGPAAGFLDDLVCRLQELRQKQEINSGIINSATDAIVTINEDHVIIGFNSGAEKMFGYARKEALGQDLTIIIPPPYKAEHRDYVRRYVATREARVIGKHVRLSAQRRDGSEFPMSISFSVAEIHDNLYFTGIIRDITENKEMEDRVMQSERLAAVGNTVTHIAHEIKTPLLVIGGFARQLLRVPGLDDKARQKLTIMAEEVSNLERLVAEMRDFVRRPPAAKRRGRLKTPISEALELFQDAFSESHIKVQRIEETPLPELNFDAKQILQVLINLFKNALEAMPRGGEITLTTRVRGDCAEVVVADTGEGMPPEVAANIFQPYFTTKAKGTGLGLAISQNIIQEHGGSLTVESTPGRGTAFTIRLPLQEPARARE